MPLTIALTMALTIALTIAMILALNSLLNHCFYFPFVYLDFEFSIPETKNKINENSKVN